VRSTARAAYCGALGCTKGALGTAGASVTGRAKSPPKANVDALSAQDGKPWVTGMPDCLPPEYRRCLVSLSNGGKDATIVREFDVETRTFVADGFVLPEAKSGTSWRDIDHIFSG
jgi:prolyl oligopeptidase PreP (S9A serine peptidase family)